MRPDEAGSFSWESMGGRGDLCPYSRVFCLGSRMARANCVEDFPGFPVGGKAGGVWGRTVGSGGVAKVMVFGRNVAAGSGSVWRVGWELLCMSKWSGGTETVLDGGATSEQSGFGC